MTIKITPQDKKTFNEAIEIIQFMRIIKNKISDEPVYLYAYIRCMEYVGELLNPHIQEHQDPNSIFRVTDFPWITIARIRDTLSHRYDIDFTAQKSVSILKSMIEDYSHLEQQLFLLAQEDELSDSLKEKLHKYHPFSTTVHPKVIFRDNLIQINTRSSVLTEDDHALFMLSIKPFDILKQIIDSQQKRREDKLAIQHLLLIIIVTMSKISEDENKRMKDYFTTTEDYSNLLLWNNLHKTREKIAHLQSEPLISGGDMLFATAQDILQLREKILLYLDERHTTLSEQDHSEGEQKVLIEKISKKTAEITILLQSDDSSVHPDKLQILKTYQVELDAFYKEALKFLDKLPSSFSSSSSSASAPTEPVANNLLFSALRQAQAVQEQIKQYLEKAKPTVEETLEKKGEGISKKEFLPKSSENQNTKKKEENVAEGKQKIKFSIKADRFKSPPPSLASSSFFTKAKENSDEGIKKDPSTLQGIEKKL